MAEPKSGKNVTAASSQGFEQLTRFERFAVKLGHACNETVTGKRAQEIFLRSVGYAWVRAAIAHRTFVHGLDELAALNVDRGVLFVSNHRTFFDQYTMMTVTLAAPASWATQLYFPVRSNFFYETPLGVLVNFVMSAGTMYPPIYRQASRSALNQATMERLAALLNKPGVVVGMHPEGTRNRGGDPYTLLPAQPGVGALALKSRAIVIPVFINGLTQNFLYELRASWSANIRRKPVICIFGAPLEYSDLTMHTPRPALYKKFADRACDEILKLSVLERQIREKCYDGMTPDDHSGWLSNRGAGKFYASREPQHSAHRNSRTPQIQP